MCSCSEEKGIISALAMAAQILLNLVGQDEAVHRQTGKDADFLVFDNDLLTAEQEGFSHNKPSEVYFCGKKMK